MAGLTVSNDFWSEDWTHSLLLCYQRASPPRCLSRIGNVCNSHEEAGGDFDLAMVGDLDLGGEGGHCATSGVCKGRRRRVKRRNKR